MVLTLSRVSKCCTLGKEVGLAAHVVILLTIANSGRESKQGCVFRGYFTFPAIFLKFSLAKLTKGSFGFSECSFILVNR